MKIEMVYDDKTPFTASVKLNDVDISASASNFKFEFTPENGMNWFIEDRFLKHSLIFKIKQFLYIIKRKIFGDKYENNE